MSYLRRYLPLLLVLLAVCATYANHFHNGFHFDDSHAVVDNPAIRSLRNLPRFFTDTTTFSVLPANRTYRPFVSASLAIDYALGHGYTPFWFQLSTFLVFLAQLIAMYALFAAILRAVRPAAEESNRLIALLAAAWYGLHPAMAETVNYIIQRGDVFSTFGVVAALAVYARWPQLRKTGLYLLPLAFALLSKPPAVVFPLLLMLYVLFFEDETPGKVGRALRAAIPSVLVCVALMALQAYMTPKSYAPSILSAAAYRITQPYVLLRYFGSFFLPLHLNVDTDLQAFAALNGAALLGFLFVALLLGAAWIAARRRITRPIAFGLLWFLIGSLPTSLFVLSEVENDHRMFLPFVGLTLAVCWAAALGVEALARRTGNPGKVKAAAAVAGFLLLTPYAYGTHLRNLVWRSDESLWLDDVQKCPHNGRGLMNYGLTQMGKGAYRAALDSFQRALLYTPNYPTLEINLGIVYGALQQPAQARQHFERALLLAPGDDQTHFFYGRWLYQTGDIADAVQQLEMAERLNPSRVSTRDLLAMAYAAQGDTEQARATAQATLKMAPGDAGALTVLLHPPTADAGFWINASLRQYQSGNYKGCIEDAQRALQLQPKSAAAYINIGAGYAGLQQWDLAVRSEREALRLDPTSTLARNNLALYTRLAAAPQTTPRTAAEWVNASLRDNQAGNYAKSIADARAALRLQPDYAEAWNNIAAASASMKNWDAAIAAARQAIRLKPDFQLAKNNLAWAESQKALQSHPSSSVPGAKTNVR